MFNEVDAINLYHVYLGSELYALDLLTPDNGSNITLGNADDPVRNTFTRLEHLLLLRQYLADHSFPYVILLRELDPDSVLISDFFLLLNDFVQQVQQASGPSGCLFPGFLAHPHVGKVLVFLFQVLCPGCRYFQILAGKLHLAIHPINAFPQKLYVGWITKVGFIAGSILQYYIGLFDIGFPGLGQYMLSGTHM